MARLLIPRNRLSALLIAIAAIFLSGSTSRPGGTAASSAALVPDLPASFSGTRTGPGRRSKVPSESSHRNLEEQASRETRETFGEDFCRQLEDEREAVREVHRRKASVGAEAGCHPSSPLSSSTSEELSLSSLGAFGSPGDDDGEGRKSGNGVEDPMAVASWWRRSSC